LYIATALEFSQSEKMHIAFIKLTNKFLEEFKKASISVNKVIDWCENLCDLYGASLTLTVSSMDELFKLIRRKLPYHNFLNLELLQLLADLSKMDCLIESVRNYETTFSSSKLNELTLSMGANIKEIQVTNKMNENCSELVTKLQEKDLTFGQLCGLTAELDEKILYLRTGATPPQWVEEGCVCIKWVIPSCLVDYAYHSACLNVDLFSEMKLMHLTIGRYTVEQKEGYSGSMSHFIMFSIQVSVVIAIRLVNMLYSQLLAIH